ncbi:hypothetical protein ABT346_20205 [Micromonospora peucetia]|uniref:hypothetical protein n=1 Tax=Micromonospora peucetia TaxID=47871 RepID=UPI0033195443
MSTVRTADLAVVLKAGRVVEQGTHAEGALVDGDCQVKVGINAGGEPVTAALTWGQQAIWKPIQWYGEQSSYLWF